ncbi:MAG: hypothetical protein HQ539_02310 [Parcubacteria group bacterium]|nr:hypothetical protein [Parcubacteria group bacterium]
MSNKQKIIFPENTSSIISSIVKKHGLEESDEDFLKKIGKGEKTAGGIIASIVKKTAEGEINKKNLPGTLKMSLKITQKKAMDLAKDINSQVLALAEKRLPPQPKKTQKPKAPLIIENQPKKTKKEELSSPIKEDNYRELVE